LKRRKKIEGKQKFSEPGQGYWNHFLFENIIVSLCLRPGSKIRNLGVLFLSVNIYLTRLLPKHLV
jgi:hypothetical protein